MLRIILDALAKGRVTEPLPAPGGGFAGAAIGRFVLHDPGRLQAAIDVCPTGAIGVADGDAVLDEGRCVFCGLCAEGDAGAFKNVPEEPAVARTRAGLLRPYLLPGAADAAARPAEPDEARRVREDGAALSAAIKKRFRRSLHVRHLDAGGCNGCEWELNQLTAPRYDVQRFGVDFVASPRHADLLLVTGVVTRNLELALVRTLAAMPRPRLVVAMGACAISGGIFATSYASRGGADRVVAVDAYVAGCPPRPWAVVRALRLAVEGPPQL